MEHEEQFAHTLAVHVLDKPKLSLWMILIPIIFVFYFYQLQKFTAGRKTFVEHYLISRKRSLDEAFEAVTSGKDPDIGKLAGLSDVPEDIRTHQARVFSILVDHYITLLRSDGDDFASLVQSAYKSLSHYLLYLNSLNNAEKDRDNALKPHLEKTQEGIDAVVKNIEFHSEKLRREIAEKIFA